MAAGDSEEEEEKNTTRARNLVNINKKNEKKTRRN